MEGCYVPVQSLDKLKLNGFSTLCRRFAVRVRNHAKMVDCYQSLEKLKLSGFSTLCMGFADVRVKKYAQMEGCYLSRV